VKGTAHRSPLFRNRWFGPKLAEIFGSHRQNVYGRGCKQQRSKAKMDLFEKGLSALKNKRTG